MSSIIAAGGQFYFNGMPMGDKIEVTYLGHKAEETVDGKKYYFCKFNLITEVDFCTNDRELYDQLADHCDGLQIVDGKTIMKSI